jgi:DNA-binding SARP family transcriptional activator
MDTRKAPALLAYLAVSGGSHTRDGLAALLWPDYDEAGARGAFRRTLSTLHKGVGPNTLEINRESIGLAREHNLWVDVVEFRCLLASCQAHPHPKQEICRTCLPLLQEAATLYQGDFMASFSLRDSANFDEWQFLQAEGLQQELAGALEKLARGLAALADYEGALHVARRWLALDPLREEAHRQMMQLYEWGGQHGAALRQYRECVRVLEQEIGVSPLDETTRPYQAIQARHLPLPAAPAELASTAPVPMQAPVGLAVEQTPPAEATGESYPFVGRALELQELWQAYQSRGTNGC